MKWASSISFETDLGAALTGIKRDLVQQLGGSPDLLLVFITPHYEDQAHRLPDLVAARVSPGLLLGCTAVGVIGGGREIEERCAVAAVGASLPDEAIDAFDRDLTRLLMERFTDEPLPTPHRLYALVARAP